MLAVATLLYDPKYLPGALVLGHVLRKIAPENIKLVVLIDKSAFASWQLELLREKWHDLVDTQVFVSTLDHKLKHALKRPELAKTYTKIELWRLPYEKVLYLDADVLPLEGYNPVTDLLKLNYPKGKILAAPDSGFPDIFNSGVFALTPDEEDYANLLEVVTSNDVNASFDGADQGLLNQYFNSNPDWVAQILKAGTTDVQNFDRIKESNWIPIPFLYNTTPNAQYQYYPASNHFGYPGNGSQNGKSIPEDSENADNINFSRIAGFKSVNVSPYENIALEHFSTPGPTSQVSVIHFIGAAKPWNNQHSPIFEKWWQQWYEYSGGKPIDVVLRLQKYSINVNPLQHPSASIGVHSDIKTPADLCDPSNYQHLKSHVGKSVDFWDATKEAPPQNASESSPFYLPRKTHSNNWDDDKIHKETPVRTANSSKNRGTRSKGVPRKGILKNKIQGTSQKRDSFGIYTDQIPDRVFDEQSDYTPDHLLMMTDRKSLFEASPNRSGFPKSSPNILEDLRTSLSRTQIDDNGHEVRQSRGASGSGSNTSGNGLGPSKIFPWESREHEPERVWE